MIAAQCAAWQHWQLWHCGARAAPWCVKIGCTAARFGFCVRSTASATALFDLRCHREQLSDSFANAPARTYNWTAVLQRVLRDSHRFEKRFLLLTARSCHSFAAAMGLLAASDAGDALVVGIGRGAVLWRAGTATSATPAVDAARRPMRSKRVARAPVRQ